MGASIFRKAKIKLSKAHNTVNQQCTSFYMQVQNQTTFPYISMTPDCMQYHLE